MTGTGWRFFCLRKGCELVPPYFFSVHDPWVPGWNTARCTKRWRGELMHGEAAPGKRCVCGFHVSPTRDGLLRLIAQAEPWPFPLVLAEVEYAGMTTHSFDLADPPGTVRVERASLLQLDVRRLPRDRQPAAVTALRGRYGVPVMDEDLHELRRALWGVG